MKAILSVLVAAGILAGVAVAQPAEARCWSNGYSWHCSHHYYYPGWRWDHPRYYPGWRWDHPRYYPGWRWGY